MMARIILSVVLVLLGTGKISAFLAKLTGFASTTSGNSYCVSTVATNYITSGTCSPVTLSSGGYNAILSCSSQSSTSAWSLGIYYSYDANCGFTPLASGTASGNGCFYSSSISYYPVFFSVDCNAASISPTRTPSFPPSVMPSFAITASPSSTIAPTDTYAPSAVFTTRYRFYGDSSCSAANIYAEAAVFNQQCFSTFLNQNGVFSYYYGKIGCAGNTLSSSWTVTFFNDSHCSIPSGQALSGSGTTCQAGILNTGSVNLQVLCSYANTSSPTISPSISPSAHVATIIAASNTSSTTCSNPLTASALILNKCSQVILATGSYLLNVTCHSSSQYSMHIYGVSTFGCVSSAFLGQYSGTSGICSQWPYSIFGYGEANYAIYCFEQRTVAPSIAPTTRPTVVPTVIPSLSPMTYVPTNTPSAMPSATIVPTATPQPSVPHQPTRTPVIAPTRTPTRRPTTNTQNSLVSLYTFSTCSDESSFLASVVMSPSSTSCTSTSSFQTLSSYAINYQSATLQCTTNTSSSGWTLNFYSGSSCSGEVADAFISSSGGCQCTNSVNNEVSANPLRIVVDCGAGNAASTGTTARVTADCSSSTTSSSGSVNTSSQAAIIGGIFASLVFFGGLCICTLWAYHKMHDSSVGVANFSDHNSLSGALPQASAPIQAMIYDPEGDDIELPHVTRIEVVDASTLPADIVFVEPQFVQFQAFGTSQSVDLEEGEIKQDDVAALRLGNSNAVNNPRPEELSPSRRYRNKQQRSGSQNRANVQAWQDASILAQSPPPQQRRSSRSLLQASSTRHSASHNSLRAVSVSTDDDDGLVRPAVIGVARIIGRTHQQTSVNVEDDSDDEGDEAV